MPSTPIPGCWSAGWLQPGLVATLLIITVSGHAPSTNWRPTPPLSAPCRLSAIGQAFGLANGGMQVAQRPWFVLAGAAASSHTMTPATAIAISGGLGAVLAAALMASRCYQLAPRAARL